MTLQTPRIRPRVAAPVRYSGQSIGHVAGRSITVEESDDRNDGIDLFGAIIVAEVVSDSLFGTEPDYPTTDYDPDL